MESTINEFYGDGKLESIDVKSLKTGEITNYRTDGVFIFIGYVPNSEPFNGIVELNKWGEIVVDKDMATNVPGVFAAGDCIAKRYRQVTTSVAEGTISALAASNYVNELNKNQ